MIRADRTALAAVALLTRAGVGCFGLVVVVWSIAMAPEPDDRARSEREGRARAENTVVLSVPEGRLAGSLTVVDESGRELATLTHWYSGNTSIVARRSGGVGVNCYLNDNATAALLLTGTAKETRIDARPDGTTTATVRDFPPTVDPPTIPNAGTPNAPEL